MVRDNQAYWLRALGLWILLMAAETLLGLWRVKVLTERLGDEVTRDVGVFTGSLIILLITFACIDWIPAHDAKTLLAIGATWVALTSAYEVVLGRLAFQFSWNEILAEFNPFQGRLLALGLAFLLLAPLLAARLRGRIGVAAPAGRGPARVV